MHTKTSVSTKPGKRLSWYLCPASCLHATAGDNQPVFPSWISETRHQGLSLQCNQSLPLHTIATCTCTYIVSIHGYFLDFSLGQPMSFPWVTKMVVPEEHDLYCVLACDNGYFPASMSRFHASIMTTGPLHTSVFPIGIILFASCTRAHVYICTHTYVHT